MPRQIVEQFYSDDLQKERESCQTAEERTVTVAMRGQGRNGWIPDLPCPVFLLYVIVTSGMKRRSA